MKLYISQLYLDSDDTFHLNVSFVPFRSSPGYQNDIAGQFTIKIKDFEPTPNFRTARDMVSSINGSLENVFEDTNSMKLINKIGEAL